jgi:hypothetical protein
LLSENFQSNDYKLPPLPFKDDMYKVAVNAKKLVVGFYIDDGFIRACPATKRAVYLGI